MSKIEYHNIQFSSVQTEVKPKIFKVNKLISNQLVH
jgi:hypothetical protein